MENIMGKIRGIFGGLRQRRFKQKPELLIIKSINKMWDFLDMPRACRKASQEVVFILHFRT